jgi:hypothetical protein
VSVAGSAAGGEKPVAFSKDASSDSHKDIVVTISTGSYALLRITIAPAGGNAAARNLVAGKDYTQAGGKITFSKDELSKLADGSYAITFIMDGGVYPSILVNIGKSAPINEGDGDSVFEDDDSGATDGATDDVTDEAPPKGGMQNPFTDVDESDWFFGDVEYAVAAGLFMGASPSTFEPNSPMTRAMLVTVLYRFANSPDVSGLMNPFTDLVEGEYYAGPVAWAAENGIVRGVGDGKFAPNEPVKRQEFAAILLRYADYADARFIVPAMFAFFSDAELIDDYAANAIQTLFNADIMRGVGGNNIDPLGDATRAQVAAMLRRYAEAIAAVRE